VKTKALLGGSVIALTILANWLAATWITTVPFTTYSVPAGVWAIGLVLVLRDWFQQIAGLWRSLVLVYVAGAASYLIGNAAGWTALEKIAVASLVAFTVSETLEAVVFTPIRNRNLSLGVALSGTVGLVVDSLLFLWLAFGSLAFLDGQLIAKGIVVAAGATLTAVRRVWLPVRTA